MKITNRDWVQLSSYLDGELNPKEIKGIEERLDKEPVLQFALEELRQTKETLQQTPKLRVPRNFTLRAEMVGIKTRPQQARGFRLVSALMSILLMGVLVLDFGRVFMGGAMAPAASKEVMLEALSESAADTVEEPVLMEAEAEMDTDRAAAEAEIETSRDVEAPAPEVAAEAMEEGESVGYAQEAESKSTGDEAPDAATNQTDEWQEVGTPEELTEPTQTFVPQESGTPVPQLITSPNLPNEETHSIDRIPSLDPFRVLEIILGLGAIIFGIAAWVIRRRKS
jgi:anti-sigma factor RsiW